MFEDYYAATCPESSSPAAGRECWLGVLRYAAKLESVGSGHQDRIRAVGDSPEEYHHRTGG